MTEEEQQELTQLVRDFQELLKSDDVDDYIRSCDCCGTFFTDDFDDKRKELLRRADEIFASLSANTWLEGLLPVIEKLRNNPGRLGCLRLDIQMVIDRYINEIEEENRDFEEWAKNTRLFPRSEGDSSERS